MVIRLSCIGVERILPLFKPVSIRYSLVSYWKIILIWGLIIYLFLPWITCRKKNCVLSDRAAFVWLPIVVYLFLSIRKLILFLCISVFAAQLWAFPSFLFRNNSCILMCPDDPLDYNVMYIYPWYEVNSIIVHWNYLPCISSLFLSGTSMGLCSFIQTCQIGS